MLGYIVPQKSELKLREFEIYNAYYCAVCRSIRDRYGQLPRLLLSYDAVFLAMLHAAATDRPETIRVFRCGTHPGRKRNLAMGTPEIDYAADIMLLLGYQKLRDDRMDEKRLRGFAGEALLRRAYRKIRSAWPQKVSIIEAQLDALDTLELAREPRADAAAEPFALLMAEALDYPGVDAVPMRENSLIAPSDYIEGLRQAYRKIGYHLGKWVYLIDAADDLEADVRHDSYNPLRYGEKDVEQLQLSLKLSLSEIADTMDLLPIRKNRAIIENIVYVGLNIKTEEIFGKLGKGSLIEQ